MGGGGLVLAADWGWELANWPQPSHSLSPASSLPKHHHHHWQERHTIWSGLNEKNGPYKQINIWVAMVPHWGRKEENNEEEEGSGESDTYTDLLCGMAVTVHLVAMHPREFRISVLEHSSALVRCVPQALLETATRRFLWSDYWAVFHSNKYPQYMSLQNTWTLELDVHPLSSPSLIPSLSFWPSTSCSSASYLDSLPHYPLSHQFSVSLIAKP